MPPLGEFSLIYFSPDPVWDKKMKGLKKISVFCDFVPTLLQIYIVIITIITPVIIIIIIVIIALID